MNFWKKKHTHEVIADKCYAKLPLSHRIMYSKTDEEPTHAVERDSSDLDNGFNLVAIETAINSNSFDSDVPNCPSPTFDGFDGGSGGGSGAGGDF